jgi:hypothetical protein
VSIKASCLSSAAYVGSDCGSRNIDSPCFLVKKMTAMVRTHVQLLVLWLFTAVGHLCLSSRLEALTPKHDGDDVV